MKHVLRFPKKNVFLLHATRFMFLYGKGRFCMRSLTQRTHLLYVYQTCFWFFPSFILTCVRKSFSCSFYAPISVFNLIFFKWRKANFFSQTITGMIHCQKWIWDCRPLGLVDWLRLQPRQIWWYWELLPKILIQICHGVRDERRRTTPELKLEQTVHRVWILTF